MSIDQSYLIVNTDLDATLLDHDTYSWQPAAEAVNLLRNRGIPLVLNSSKTLSEMKDLAAELGIQYPLVCENGSLVAIPQSGELSLSDIEPHVSSIEDEEGYWICYLGQSREEVIRIITQLRSDSPECAFMGYGDWTTEEVAEHTGLPIEKACLSHQRCGTEPIHWHGSEEAFADFISALESHNLQAVSGGRFIHLSGKSDKANGLKKVSAIYQNKLPERDVKTIALGDSPNDLGMLNAADIAVVIPNKVQLSPTAPKVILAEEHGPKGWNTVMKSLLG